MPEALIRKETLDKFLIFHVDSDLSGFKAVSSFFDDVTQSLEKGQVHQVIYFHEGAGFSSTFLGFFYEAIKKIREKQGSMQMISESNHVNDMIEIGQLERFVPVYFSMERFKNKNLDPG